MQAESRALSADPGALRYLLRKDVLRRCGLIAVVVGCILTLANQYDALFFGPFTAKLAARIGVNFLVPFVVSSTSAAVNRRRSSR